MLADVTRAAVGRLLADGGADAITSVDELFNDDEKQTLANQLAATNATAELLGRARIRERADGGLFSEQGTSFRIFDETSKGGPIAPMAPAEALDFFRSLVPTLNVDPKRFGPRMEREAFTLAVATDAVLLDRVKAVIEDRLASGEVSDAPEVIQAILDDAGVGENNGAYSEAIWRTNSLDAYNTGAQRELDEVSQSFPAWVYMNPDDGRSRPEHAAKNGKIYSTKIPFTEVRGTDAASVINCRCTFRPVHKLELAELKKAGVTVEGDDAEPTPAEIAQQEPRPAPTGNAGVAKLTPEALGQVQAHFEALLAEAEFERFSFDRLKASVESARALSRLQLQQIADAINAQTTAAKSKEDILAAISNRIGGASIQTERIGNVAPAAPEGFEVPPLPELPKVEPPKPKQRTAPTTEPDVPAIAAPTLADLPAELQPYVVNLRAIRESAEQLTFDEIDAAVDDAVSGLNVGDLSAVCDTFGAFAATGKKGDLVRAVKTTIKATKIAASRTGLR